MRSSSSVCLAIVVGVGLLSCNGYPAPDSGGLASGLRLITGQLLVPNGGELGARDVALQLAAVTFPGAQCEAPKYSVGPAFDPALGAGGGSRGSIGFSITVPCDQSVHLFLQRASAGVSVAEGSPDSLVVAPLVFAAYAGGPLTSTIPGIDPSLTGGPCADPPGGQLLGRRIDLGTIALPARPPATVVLGEDSSQNPLKQLNSTGGPGTDFDTNGQNAMSGGDGGTAVPIGECEEGDGVPAQLR